MIFEADANLARFGYRRRDLFALLRGLVPYRFHFPRDDAWVPADPDSEDPAFTDLIAVPEGRAASPR